MKITAMALLAAAAASVFAINVPVGTFIYSGSVMNYKHEVLGAGSGLTVQAVNADGVVLASCRVIDPADSQGVNYVLEVPVSTTASAKSAAVGDLLRCVIISSSGTTNVSPTSLPPVQAANAIAELNIVSASVTAYKYFDGVVYVADDYVAGLIPLMKYIAKTSTYTADGDWDGDGATNYEEYVAGTNPFDPSDYLHITAFAATPTQHVLSFEYAGGHLYTLKSSASLTNDWSRASFSVESPDNAKQETFVADGDEEDGIGTAVLFTTHAVGSPSGFYKIGVE